MLGGGVAGCAHYEYDLVDPPNLAQHIGSKSDAVFTLDPLLYRMRSVDDYLVILIHNRTDEPIRLLADHSFAVDPKGQSHPLRAQTIGPRSYIKLVLPPPPPDVQPAGPVFSFGVGWGYPHPYWPGWYDPFWGPVAPAYTVVVTDPNYYWAWDDEGDATLSLTYQRGTSPTFTHQFRFHRRKM